MKDRKGWKDALLPFLGSPWLGRWAIVLWLAVIEVQVIDGFKWRTDATILLRDMGTAIQWHEEHLSRLSIAVARRDPNGWMDFGPSVADANDAELIQAAIDEAEEY